MKKYLFCLIAFASCLVTQAQLRTTTRSNVQQGQFLDYPGSLFAATPTSANSDTLQISDTVAYILPVTHTNDVSFYHTWYWAKSGAGTATITVSFFQGNDPFNFVAIKAGTAQAAYTKVVTVSATGWQVPISFAADTARFEGRYLKVQYMTSNTASVGGKVFSRTKSNIK